MKTKNQAQLQTKQSQETQEWHAHQYETQDLHSSFLNLNSLHTNPTYKHTISLNSSLHKPIANIPISITLLNQLRLFQQQSTQQQFLYSQSFLIRIGCLLREYQDLQQISQWLSQRAAPPPQIYILYIHIQLALFINLEIIQLKVSPINKVINSSNLYNAHSIFERIQKFQNDQFEEFDIINQWSSVAIAVCDMQERGFKKKSKNKLSKDDLEKQKINSDMMVKNTVYIQMLYICVQQKGNLDIHFGCYLGYIINPHLLHVHFTKHAENYLENYSLSLMSILKQKIFLHSFQTSFATIPTKAQKTQLQEQWFIQKRKLIVQNKLQYTQLLGELPKGEKVQELLIGIMGSQKIQLRDAAIKLLNCYYDNTNWQLYFPYLSPVITTIGKQVNINYLIEASFENEVLIMFHGWSQQIKSRCQVTSWHRPKILEYKSKKIDQKYHWVKCRIGIFTKSGFYDWKLVRVTNQGTIIPVYKITTKSKEIQLKHSEPIQGRFIVHPKQVKDIQIHQVFVDQRTSKENVYQKGNFRSVRSSLDYYKDLGVNCIYLLGALQRDNGLRINPTTGKEYYLHPKVSPLSITDRSSINKMLGGQIQLDKLIKSADQHEIKILLDCLTRVSSSRMHKKYRNHVLYRLDQEGKLGICFGSDGRGISYNDTVMLNYRKKAVWDQHIQEILKLIRQFHIQGLHLDNCQSWPQILRTDVQQMYRIQSDGLPAYSHQQIFNGIIVLEGDRQGYWQTREKERYPNPFLIKMVKSVWRQFNNFVFVGECWGQLGGFGQRTTNIINSGVIPRIFKLSAVLCQVFGDQLQKDGTLTKIQPKNVNVLKKWYEQTKNLLSKGAIIAQSTTSHNWPYPAKLFKRATWPVVDLFFFLPDIPMTFIGQQEGHAYRVKTTNVFTSSKKNERQVEDQFKNTYKEQLKRLDSSFFMQSSTQPKRIEASSISNVPPQYIRQAEQSLRSQVGPQFGYDLKQIVKHYKSRRHIRHQNEVIRKGIFIPVNAQHMYGIHRLVMSYVLYSKTQMALIGINFNSTQVYLSFNLKNLKPYFPDASTSSITVQVVNNKNQITPVQNYFFIGQLVNEKIDAELSGYGSLIWFLKIGQQTKKAQEGRILRLKKKMNNKIPQTIYSSDLCTCLLQTLQKNPSLSQFSKTFFSLNNIFKITPVLTNIFQFQTNQFLCNKLFSYLHLMKKYPHKIQGLDQVIKETTLGKIIFVAPEIGKWSTAGGLGVMVDQLTKQLYQAGQQVVVISPYYQKNKKGQKGYLSQDGFEHLFNLQIWSGPFKYLIGVNGGTYGGIMYYFLHNSQLFPYVYAGEDPLYRLKQLVFFAKASLQLLCKANIKPAIFVQNDWFSALCSAYVKVGKFGDYFTNCKFLHIAHNLNQLYQGRIYPSKQMGDMIWVHQLPYQYLVDPFWDKVVINPSRCALMSVDNWATVSHSYKLDLLNYSPLKQILNKYPQAFSFPNGVRKTSRLMILKQKTPGNYKQAKTMLLKKYFNKAYDENIPLFSFVGRVTQQKGVHLILQIIQQMIYMNNFNILFLIGGPADYRQEYGKICAQKMEHLKFRFPQNIWCQPKQFFYDGPLINIGSDFGLMPSMFQPGGIVQHQFFAASTPVVAYKTGGLKDTVFQYDYKKKKGNGCNFIHYQANDFKQCLKRAVRLFHNKSDYQICKKNAFQSVIDVKEVARAWNQQFHRMNNKLLVQWTQVQNHSQKIIDDGISTEIIPLLQKKKGTIFTQETELINGFERTLAEAKRKGLRTNVFKYETNKLPLPKKVNFIYQVYVSGTWDDWKSKQLMLYNNYWQGWSISLQLLPGTYHYKYIVDDEWLCCETQTKQIDIHGNINNILILQ